MFHHLPALLLHLAAPSSLAADDVDPLAIFDGATRAVWMSEVRRAACGTSLTAELILMPMPDDSVHRLIRIEASASRRFWSIDACSVGGRPVPIDPEAVMTVLAASRHQIRSGLVPEFDQLLLDHAGLRLPIVARYASLPSSGRV